MSLHGTTLTDEQRRRLAQQRVEACRDRRKHGRVLVSIEVEPLQLAAFERLALLEVGERDKAAIAWAVERYLASASHVSAMGDALWPASEDEAA
jgi:hypothetical protein